MPHPRINANLKGEYVRISDWLGKPKSRGRDMAGWLNLADVQSAKQNADGTLTIKVQGQPDHVYRGKNREALVAGLRKKGKTVT